MLQGKLPVHHERDLFAQTRRFAVAPPSFVRARASGARIDSPRGEAHFHRRTSISLAVTIRLKSLWTTTTTIALAMRNLRYASSSVVKDRTDCRKSSTNSCSSCSSTSTRRFRRMRTMRRSYSAFSRRCSRRASCSRTAANTRNSSFSTSAISIPPSSSGTSLPLHSP